MWLVEPVLLGYFVLVVLVRSRQASGIEDFKGKNEGEIDNAFNELVSLGAEALI